ncbi:hypothetical protein Mapa_014809 [Marchantia paleacea]|nr:hypothetical protein Mapa_014809 [Marchantia paleacea]
MDSSSLCSAAHTEAGTTDRHIDRRRHRCAGIIRRRSSTLRRDPKSRSLGTTVVLIAREPKERRSASCPLRAFLLAPITDLAGPVASTCTS